MNSIVYISAYNISNEEFVNRLESIYRHMRNPYVIVLADNIDFDIVNKYDCTVIKPKYNNPEWYAMMYHYVHHRDKYFTYVSMVLTKDIEVNLIDKSDETCSPLYKIKCSNSHVKWCNEHTELLNNVLKLHKRYKKYSYNDIHTVVEQMNKCGDTSFVKDSNILFDYLQTL